MIIILLILLIFSSPAMAQIQALTQGPDENIWAAEPNRLFKIAANVEIVTWYQSPGTIRTLLFDDHQNLWIGTDQGLVRCKNNECKPDSRIPAAAVIALAPGNEALWIATNEKLYQIRNNTITSAALPSNRIEAIAAKEEGSVWVGTRSSVQIFRNGSFQEMLKTSAQAIAIDPTTGAVWIGAGHELIRRENGKTETFSLPAPPANVRMRPPITAILPTRSGKIYLGTHGGLLQLSNGSFRKVLDEGVFALLEDKKRTLWIGTSDGLKKIVNGKIMDVPLPE